MDCAIQCLSRNGSAGDSSSSGRSRDDKVGLSNLGNTCYLNSVLQALFMTKSFRNEVLQREIGRSHLFDRLQELFALLQFSTRKFFAPTDLLREAKPLNFEQGQQHDSSEFLCILMEHLHEEERRYGGAKGGSIPKQMNPEGAEGEAASSVMPTLVQQSFVGKTLTLSRCVECGTKSERGDNFRELQLSFTNHSDNQTVQTLLDYYLQPEKLISANQYLCDFCSRLTDGERLTNIIEAPARLILTLKHFRYDPTSHQHIKLLQNVSWDEHLYLNNYRYELYSAVVHCGSSLDSGHYYTLAKEKKGWYKFNDSLVSKATQEDLSRFSPSDTPYILFYSREDVLDVDDLSYAMLHPKLQLLLNNDSLELERETVFEAVRHQTQE